MRGEVIFSRLADPTTTLVARGMKGEHFLPKQGNGMLSSSESFAEFLVVNNLVIYLSKNFLFFLWFDLDEDFRFVGV